MAVAAHRVQQVDLAGMSDEALRPLAELANALRREWAREDPDQPLDLVIARFRAMPDTMERTDWIATNDDGTLVGRATMVRELEGRKQHARQVDIGVLPAHRRRGLGRALLAEVVRAAGDDAGILLGFYTVDRIPAGEALLRRLGAEAGLVTKANQLDLTAVDRELVERWRALAPEGYHLVWIDGDVPEELIGHVAAAYSGLNATPQGSLRIWDFNTTSETVRAYERSRRAAGREHRFLLAIEDATGEAAGFTEVHWHPQEPHAIWQGGTAVIERHQGRGIGKWLKGQMVARVLGELPRARHMRANNATINPPILSINGRLGFRPVWTNTVWQLPIADARRYLSERVG